MIRHLSFFSGRPALAGGRLLLAIGVLAQTAGLAQEQYRHFAPAKDVAMLVDVSVSVRDDRAGHSDARKIIAQLLAGQAFSTKQFDNWEMETPDEGMKELFAAYLGLPLMAQSAEMRPLMEPGRSFLSLPVGELSTVLNGEMHRTLRDVQGVKELVEAGYPKRMDDTSTCYWYAMAQAADTLSQKSKLGYYLFVVSDEEDDPDYRETGPPGHTAADYKAYVKGLSKTMPEAAIRANIEKFFNYKGQRGMVDRYEPRGDFKQVTIAKFYQSGARASSKKVRLSWYAMGVTPERVKVPRPPPPPAPGVPAPPQPIAYEPPKQTPRIQMLGGVESGSKTFTYQQPLLVWQISHMEGSGWESSGSRPSIDLGAGNSKKGLYLKDSPRKVLKSWQLPEQLENGNYAVSLEVEGTVQSGSTVALTKDFKVVRAVSSMWWLTILAVVSGVAALGIFFYAWRSLRQGQNRVTVT